MSLLVVKKECNQICIVSDTLELSQLKRLTYSYKLTMVMSEIMLTALKFS